MNDNQSLPQFAIAGRPIGDGAPCYVIAEMSANHLGKLDRAKRIIDAAANAGADAIKLQTYTAETITLNCPRAPFIAEAGTIWAGRRLHDLYEEAHTPWDWHEELFDCAHNVGLHVFSSPFDATAVDFLEQLDSVAYKIASFELVDIPLLQKVAATGKPIIMSTGMATLAEIKEAVQAVRAGGNQALALLKTNSAYPAPIDEMNLAAIAKLKTEFGVVVGLSDHTLTTIVPVVAVALGAAIVEKHLTLARADGGPDGAFSLEPDEFATMVEAVRLAEQAIGEAVVQPTKKELASRAFRRSLFIARAVKKGEAFTEENVRSVRPAGGLHPRYLTSILGKHAAVELEPGTPLSWSHVAESDAGD